MFFLKNLFLWCLAGSRTRFKKCRADLMVRGRAAGAGAGGVLSLRHRMVFSALACGVRAKDDGAIGIMSITHIHTKLALTM